MTDFIICHIARNMTTVSHLSSSSFQVSLVTVLLTQFTTILHAGSQVSCLYAEAIEPPNTQTYWAFGY